MMKTTAFSQSDPHEVVPFFMKKVKDDFRLEDYEEYEFRKGQTIYHEGHFPIGVFYIRNGRVKIFSFGGDGKEQIIHILYPGQFFGFKEIMGETRYFDSASALEKTVLTIIPKEEFMANLDGNEDLQHQFTHMLCKELVNLEKRLIDMSYTPVRGRLAEALLNLMRNKPPGDNANRISMSRNDLASFVGTSKETVTRLISEFKRGKLIDVDGRTLYIQDSEGLQRIIDLYY
jgi:CRP-like cAMP-binding protein